MAERVTTVTTVAPYTEAELEMYRDGFADALRWVLDHVELDLDDYDQIEEILNT